MSFPSSDESRRNFIKLSLLGLAGAVQGCAPRGPDSTSVNGLSVNALEAAEKLSGLDYSDAERAQMLSSGFDDMLDGLRALRVVEKPNNLAPALAFDPALDGADRSGAVEARPAARTEANSPQDPESIAFASILDQAAWLRGGQLSSRDLTEIYLDRIGKYGGQLECFVTVTKDLALAQADAADRELAAGRDRGVLHGIPYGLKDIIDTQGVLTTWGAAPYKNRTPDADATIVRRLRDAGAVLLGKTTSGAIAYGDIWFEGRTRNPWNLEEGSSGSSAGSASATAAGLVGFSIGTETLGSIVSPSTRCGTAGLRPTFGRVARTGAMALCWSLDKIGPITRHIEDAAFVLAAINGADPGDASSFDARFVYDGNADLRAMRVGFDPAWFEGAAPLEVAAFETLKGLGVQLVEFNTPDLPVGPLVSTVWIEAAAAFEELTLSNRDDDLVWQDDRAWPNTWRKYRLFSAVDHIQVDRLRRRFMIEMAKRFEGVDVMFGPNFAGGMLTITNFTGHPQVAIRGGFEETPTRTLFGQVDDESGPAHRVPRAVSFWSPLYEEGRAVALAHALEAELGAALERPPLFSGA